MKGHSQIYKHLFLISRRKRRASKIIYLRPCMLPFLYSIPLAGRALEMLTAIIYMFNNSFFAEVMDVINDHAMQCNLIFILN